MLDYWLADVGVPEAELWRMSWLALDARCRHHERQGWDRWDHTRHLLAAWTGQRPAQILRLPTDGAASTKQQEPPPPEFFEEMYARASAFTTP